PLTPVSSERRRCGSWKDSGMVATRGSGQPEGRRAGPAHGAEERLPVSGCLLSHGPFALLRAVRGGRRCVSRITQSSGQGCRCVRAGSGGGWTIGGCRRFAQAEVAREAREAIARQAVVAIGDQAAQRRWIDPIGIAKAA